MRKIALTLIVLFSSGYLNTGLALELENNQTISFELDGNSLNSNIFIDIPANANTLKVEINNGVIGSDFDLFMKFGSDFSGTTFNALLSEANFSSAGVDANEYFTASTALNTPLKEGKWYITAYNFNNQPELINLTASFSDAPLSAPEIQFIFDQNTIQGSDEPCDISGWNDTTPFTPISGNNATTRGQARKNAVLKAAELMTQNLQSTVPLIIQGCWPNDLETSATSAVLANAGARTFATNSKGLTPNTWYPIAIAERQAGTQSCKLGFSGGCDAHSILINFNPKIDTNEGLGSARWYYGLNNTSPNNNPDFISTALHEMTHGLGFSSAIRISDEDSTITCPGNQQITHTMGTMLCNQIDIYSSLLVQHNTDNTTSALSEMATDEERAEALVNSSRLLWNSEETNQSTLNTLSDRGLGFVQLYAPSTINPGSSVSHLSRAYTELMEPFQDANLRELGLATPMLWDMGWDPRPKNQKTIPLGIYSDPAHNGHGFIIEPISTADGIKYFTAFFTYKEDGTPEWYTSFSEIENNVLNINASPEEGALKRFIYDFTVGSSGNPNSLDPNLGSTSLSIDFNDTSVASSVACNDGVTRGSNRALASWVIGDQSGDWCIEPISNIIGLPPSNDFGAQWWAGSDDEGWGVSLSFTGENNTVIVATLYYFDASGSPRWAIGTQPGFEIGESITIDLRERTGYARDAEPVELGSTSAGSITITLNSKNGDLNDGVIDLDVNYQGEEGGNWSRVGLPITLLTNPHN